MLNKNSNAHTSPSYSAPASRNTKNIHNFSSSSRSKIDVKEITNNINSNSIMKNSNNNDNVNINININISNDMKMNEDMKPLDSNNFDSGNIWISTISSYSSSTTNSMNMGVSTCKPIQPIEKREPIFLESAIFQVCTFWKCFRYSGPITL